MSADVLRTPPLELVLRAALAFGFALWCAIQLSPPLLQRLLPYYEQVVHQLDDHYRIDFELTHQTGRGAVSSDLVILGTATVTRTFLIFGRGRTIPMYPGEALKCSTATGVFTAPAVMLLGLVLGWPANSWSVRLRRSLLGLLTLAAWGLLGIPIELWIYFHDIPVRAYSPNTVTFLTGVGKFLLNGGGVALGALLAFSVIWVTNPRAVASQPECD